MQLILKENPLDFYVEEIIPKEYFTNVNSNIYLYKITKKNLAHKNLEQILKTKFKKNFYYAGMKDKNALTIQYITSHEKINDFEIFEKDYYIKLEFVNNTKKHLFTGANLENYFKIKTNSFKEIKKIQYIGSPNYFDTQRFGNTEYLKITLSVLNNDFENALKFYLTRDSFNEETKTDRLEIEKNWYNLNNLNKKIKEKVFEKNQYKKQIFELILNKEFEKAFNLLNEKDLQFYYKQFQSHLWNELLKEIVKDYKYKEFESLYYPLEKIPNLELPLPNSKSNYKKYQKHLEIILERHNIKQKHLEKIIPKTKELRKTTFFPKDLKQKEFIEFRIKKGCYATIFLKHLFAINYI